jgi:hypothetical protein
MPVATRKKDPDPGRECRTAGGGVAVRAGRALMPAASRWAQARHFPTAPPRGRRGPPRALARRRPEAPATARGPARTHWQMPGRVLPGHANPHPTHDESPPPRGRDHPSEPQPRRPAGGPGRAGTRLTGPRASRWCSLSLPLSGSHGGGGKADMPAATWMRRSKPGPRRAGSGQVWTGATL